MPDLRENVEGTLRNAGWSESPPGPMGSLWTASGGIPGTIAVPARIIDGSQEWISVVQRISRWLGRDVPDVERLIRYFNVDVAYTTEEPPAPDRRVEGCAVSPSWRCCCCPSSGESANPESALRDHWARDCPSTPTTKEDR